MLDELHVSNIALIEDATIAFSPGLTVLTGETGAGKTALLAALKLICGARADASVVRDGAEEALAEAKSLAAAQFAQYGMPSAPEDMLAGYAEKILADKDQGQKIYEKLYEVKVVEDVKSKVKVTEKAVSADDFAKLAKEL